MTGFMKALGSCFCETVRYEIELPSKFVAHCHCSECRRAAGAPLVTWLGSWEEKLRILAGAEELSTYRHAPDSVREFCRICGSQLFFRCERWPGEVHVTRATIAGDVDRLPQAHVYFSDHASWFDPGAKLPLLGGEDGVTPLNE